jgi:hypothetical protein
VGSSNGRRGYPGPSKFDSPQYKAQADELVALSAGLTDRQKMISEYWSDSPDSPQVAAHWTSFAQFVSERDHHTLDDDVKMFFALSNAMFDASIAAWDAKREYDSVRPVTAIPLLFRGRTIGAWGGPGKGTVQIDGSQWIPYQRSTFPTPPSPDFVSDESAISAAAARTLALWTGSDRFGESVTLAAGSSKIEPGHTPLKPVVLQWETFSDAAIEAGMSGLYGGIHFRAADVGGRQLGSQVASRVWSKAQSYFDGSADPRISQPSASERSAVTQSH